MFHPHGYLYADDAVENRELFRHAYRRSGLKRPLVMVPDGHEVITYLRGEEPFQNRYEFPLPAVLLLDLYMPRLNGLDTLKEIRASPEFKKLIVILFTGSGERRDVESAFAAGANSCIEKPMEFTRLVEVIKLLDAYWLECNVCPETLGVDKRTVWWDG